MDTIKNLTLNWVDVLVFILLIRSVYVGAGTGLTVELFKFIGIIFSLIVAIHWYGQVADVFVVNFSLPAWLSEFISFVAIAQILRVIFKYGVAFGLRVLNLQFLPPLERVGGGIVGFGRGIFLSGILIVALAFLPSSYITESIHERSLSGKFLIKACEKTYKSLTFWLPEKDKTDKTIFLSIPTWTKV